jgi:large subunit ribosomal protein L17
MRHRVAYRKLGRTTPHRRALLRNLATALFEKERIRTTLPKAKELRPFAERMITLARRDENRLHVRRLVARDIRNPAVVKKLFDTIGARFATRPGGYTRILRLGPRKGDGAEMALLELVGYEYKPAGKEDKGGKGTEKAAKPEKTEKKEAAASSASGTRRAAKKAAAPKRRRTKEKAE